MTFKIPGVAQQPCENKLHTRQLNLLPWIKGFQEWRLYFKCFTLKNIHKYIY